MQRWLDYATVPPAPLPTSTEGILAYLTQSLGHACYESWTLARIKKTYPALGDAKNDKPRLFALLLDHELVIEWWQGGRLMYAPGDQAPTMQDVLTKLLRSHRQRFQLIDDAWTSGQEDNELSWIALVDNRAPAALRSWLTSRVGRFQNTNSATNTLAVDNDASALILFLQERASRSQHTLRAYVADLRKLISWSRDYHLGPLSDLSRDDLLAYKRHLSEPYVTIGDDGVEQLKGPGSSTQARAIAVIASIYQYWFDTGYLIANPASGLVSGTQVRTGFAPSRFLPAAVLSACDRVMSSKTAAFDVDLAQQRRHAIWALFRYTGVRLAELAWDSKTNFPRIGADETGRWALYVQGKGKKLRAIPLPEVATIPIKAYRIGRGLSSTPSEFEVVPLIHGFKGGSLMESGLYSQVKEIFLEVANSLEHDDPARHLLLAAASPHWLRHAYAKTLVVDHQVPLTVAQSLLGHESIQTTAGYSKTDLSQLREFVDQSFQKTEGSGS